MTDEGACTWCGAHYVPIAEHERACHKNPDVETRLVRVEASFVLAVDAASAADARANAAGVTGAALDYFSARATGRTIGTSGGEPEAADE